ncbi:putative recombination and DNA repair protein [Blattamonas nauphoetae]|uniref:Recombination and DNA repair protein n=1 Tax=Blattamonas nauphoetae TaxID=2049346 RepID=A0ABQ9Y1S3_9EUKA|nr:putative recombination and DNA repair protein [Blattamonas nauphoetae]
MLILRALDETGNEKIYLLNKKTITLGRAGCDICIKDASVSRNQAELTITPLNKGELGILDKHQGLFIQDNSRFGTSVNGTLLNKNEQVSLGVGNVITFSTCKIRFTVDVLPLVFCFSSISSSDKMTLETKLSFFGHISPSWTSNCTHLIMNKASFTEKCGMAFIHGKPIVRPDFITSISSLPVDSPPSTLPPQLSHQSLEQDLYHRLPRISDFLPDVDESFHCPSMSLLPNFQRKNLFKGLQFLFLSDNILRNYQKIVIEAGGTTKEINKSFLDWNLWLSQHSSRSSSTDIEVDNLTLLEDEIEKEYSRCIFIGDQSHSGLPNEEDSNSAFVHDTALLNTQKLSTPASIPPTFRCDATVRLIRCLQRLRHRIHTAFEIPGAIVEVGFDHYLSTARLFALPIEKAPSEDTRPELLHAPKSPHHEPRPAAPLRLLPRIDHRSAKFEEEDIFKQKRTDHQTDNDPKPQKEPRLEESSGEDHNLQPKPRRKAKPKSEGPARRRFEVDINPTISFFAVNSQDDVRQHFTPGSQPNAAIDSSPSGAFSEMSVSPQVDATTGKRFRKAQLGSYHSVQPSRHTTSIEINSPISFTIETDQVDVDGVIQKALTRRDADIFLKDVLPTDSLDITEPTRNNNSLHGDSSGIRLQSKSSSGKRFRTE